MAKIFKSLRIIVPSHALKMVQVHCVLVGQAFWVPRLVSVLLLT